jgi:hypothetical protein
MVYLPFEFFVQRTWYRKPRRKLGKPNTSHRNLHVRIVAPELVVNMIATMTTITSHLFVF